MQEAVVGNEGPDGADFFSAAQVRRERRLRVGGQDDFCAEVRDGQKTLDERDLLFDAQLFAQPALQLFSDGDELRDAPDREAEECPAHGVEAPVARRERPVVHNLYPLEPEQSF